MRSRSNGRVTLADIARATGYSITAVSRALKDMGDIGQETRAYIQKTAREMGYVANQSAVALRSGRTHILAVILWDITNPFFSITTDRIQLAAQEAGYSLMIICSRAQTNVEVQMVEQAIARCVDGVLLFPTSRSRDSIRRLREANVPFVLLANPLEPNLADSVVYDDFQGAYAATRHLIEAGRRKLAFLSASLTTPSYSPRRNGFERACADAGIPDADRVCVHMPYLNIEQFQHSEYREKARDHLLRLRAEGFNGLFVFCDIEAWRIMEVLKGSDSFQQDDFGIVGFDNIDGALLSPTPLCSVDGSLDEMARLGVQLLRSRIHGDTRPPQAVVCSVRLVCRDSCCRGGGRWR